MITVNDITLAAEQAAVIEELIDITREIAGDAEEDPHPDTLYRLARLLKGLSELSAGLRISLCSMIPLAQAGTPNAEVEK